MNSGVIYYNAGDSHVVRLLVSLFSLRQHYTGPVTILSEGNQSHEICRRIAEALSADWQPWQCGVPSGRDAIRLAKTQYHNGTPYEITLALDSDTVVLGTIDELFSCAEASTFCVARLGGWRSAGQIVSRRIRQWETWLPEDVQTALKFGPAINCGAIAFRRDSAFYKDWLRLALLGRETFIPDEACSQVAEACCQVVLHRYQHQVLDSRWNRSCKYDDPTRPDTKIVHFHGNRHCCAGLPVHGMLWMSRFEEVRRGNLAGIEQWLPAGDEMLQQFARSTAKPLKPAQASSCEPVHRQVSTVAVLKVVLGADKTGQHGWISTNRDVLNVTDIKTWQALFNTRQVDQLLAEHVWEHLTLSEGKLANENCFRFLAPGGRLRLAVPDGLHPDPKYREHVRPGGSGPQAHEHQVLYDHILLSSQLEAVGFKVELLEYWDEHGEFHWKDWAWHDGYIARSFRFDIRNRDGRPRYTSLIVDVWKP